MSDRPIPDWQVVPSNAEVHVHLNVSPTSLQVPSFSHGFGLQALSSKGKDANNSDGIKWDVYVYVLDICYLHWYNQIHFLVSNQISAHNC